jgi:hypothetical protein
LKEKLTASKPMMSIAVQALSTYGQLTEAQLAK